MIIVRAGPVGLWLACELKLAGVDVAVIERRTECTPQSRALTIHGRSLEVFALRGLTERFLAIGKQIPTGHYGVLDTRLDFSPFETRFPYTLFIPQAVTEKKFEERALELASLLTIPEVNRRLAGEVSGFDITYGAKENHQAAGFLSAGVRVPDTDLTLANGNTVSLYSLLKQGNWLHLIFNSGTEAARPTWLVADAVYEVEAKVPTGSRVFSSISALLVRPDGFVASVAQC